MIRLAALRGIPENVMKYRKNNENSRIDITGQRNKNAVSTVYDDELSRNTPSFPKIADNSQEKPEDQTTDVNGYEQIFPYVANWQTFHPHE